MRENLRVDTVFQGRNEVAAARVILRVGGKHNHQVERNPDIEAADLDVLFLHDVE